MTILSYNKDMGFLLPKKLRDYFNPNDICLLVEKVMEYLRLSQRCMGIDFFSIEVLISNLLD
ncbi:MAG: hypothetical protein LBB45_08690 [Methanobrevibacter sp.]|jgi:hypothetical protein|nr:hypothetical protein [Candidatus Methanovirga basalitermitum]